MDAAMREVLGSGGCATGGSAAKGAVSQLADQILRPRPLYVFSHSYYSKENAICPLNRMGPRPQLHRPAAPQSCAYAFIPAIGPRFFSFVCMTDLNRAARPQHPRGTHSNGVLATFFRCKFKLYADCTQMLKNIFLFFRNASIGS